MTHSHKSSILLRALAVLAIGAVGNAQSQVVAWGSNGNGQCNVPALPAGVTYVQVASGGSSSSIGHSIALRSDRSLVTWGSGTGAMPTLPTGVSFIGVAAGDGFNVARCSDGQVVVSAGAPGPVPALPPGITYAAVSAGGGHCLALRSDGSAVAWGSNSVGQCNVAALPAGLTYVEVAAGWNHSLARRSDGSVVAWGDNSSGQCNVPLLPSGVTYVELAAAQAYTLARRSDGTVVAWGQDLYGQCNVPALPVGLTYERIAATGEFGVIATGPQGVAGHSIALRSDGAVLAWGFNFFGQCDVPPPPSGHRYVEIAAGPWFSVARLEDADCNNDGLRDDLDIGGGLSVDCNGNGVPDECDLVHAAATDCNGNGLVDSCEIAGNPSLDSNLDGRLDACSLVCEARWRTDIGGHAGIDGAVQAMIVWDDGTGPALYVGGLFQHAGGVAANSVAKWDGGTWSALGSGVSGGEVRAFAIYDEGSGPKLFVAGTFTSAGGSPSNWIARWDGTTWTPVGSGPSGGISALAVYDSGAGPGLFTNRFDKWNGSSWSSIPPTPPVSIGQVGALAVYDDGSGPELYFGGLLAGGAAFARWDGSHWANVSCGFDGYRIISLGLFDDGAGPGIYPGATGSYAGLSRWNGTACSPLGAGLAATPGAAAPAVDVCSQVAFDDGSGPALFVGGRFNSAAGTQVNNIAKWDGSNWSRLGTGTNDVGTVLCMCAFDDGTGPALYVAGDFTAVGHEPANHIAIWGLPGEIPPSPFCEPGSNGVMACPCSNPALGPGRGCNNSSGTGGAQLTATGRARLGNDTLVFTTSGQTPSASSIVLQGSSVDAMGIPMGQGVRCTGGSLKRLYLKTASSGSITAPVAGDPRVSARSAALGSPIAPGTHRYYGVYYRDSIILGGCPATSGFNVTQQLDVLWMP